RPDQETEGDEGGGRQPARPDDGVLQQQPRQRQYAQRPEPADAARGRWLQARTAPGVRSEGAAVVKPVRDDAAAAGGEGRAVRGQQGGAEGAGCQLRSLASRPGGPPMDKDRREWSLAAARALGPESYNRLVGSVGEVRGIG